MKKKKPSQCYDENFMLEYCSTYQKLQNGVLFHGLSFIVKGLHTRLKTKHFI